MRRGGFTLVEVLIALTILGLLAGVIFGSFRLGAQVWRTTTVISDKREQVQVVQNMIRRVISEAVPLVRPGPNRRRYVTFSGKATEVNFITHMPSYAAGGGLAQISLAIEEGTKGGQLVAHWAPYFLHPSANEGIDERRVVLVQGVGTAAFGYFGAAEPRQRPSWTDRWTKRTLLPTLVRLQITLANGKPWPDLIVAPKAVGGR